MSKKGNVDRLSLLLTSLIHKILSSLNTQQVVQTCVLSRSWEYIWIHIPTLDFDFKSYYISARVKEILFTRIKETSFRNFVFSVLSRHSGATIKKLSYTSGQYNFNLLLVELLISYARFHSAEELSIDTSVINRYFNWMRCLSQWESLTVLNISCSFMYNWGLLVLPSLKTLQIRYARKTWDGGEGNNGNMFEGCPNLKYLVLINYFDMAASICGPKLENLELSISLELELPRPEFELLTPNLKCVKFENMLPKVKCDLDLLCLEKVNIAIKDGFFTPEYSDEDDHFAEDLLKLIRVFHNTKSLTIPLKAIEVFLSVPAGLSECLLFHNLKYLKLKTKETNNKITDLSIGLLTYLQKCPSLETLLIDHK